MAVKLRPSSVEILDSVLISDIFIEFFLNQLMLGLVHLVALINPLAEYINLVSKVIDTRSEIGLTDATEESADPFVLATKEKRG